MARFVPVACFWLCLLLTAALATLVGLAPRYQTPDSHLALRLYAQDETVRKVTLASAAGLAATGFIFFRPAPLRFGRVRRPDGTTPEATDLAGA